MNYSLRFAPESWRGNGESNPNRKRGFAMKKDELPEDRLAPDRLPDLAKGAGLNLCPIPSAFGNAVMMVS